MDAEEDRQPDAEPSEETPLSTGAPRGAPRKAFLLRVEPALHEELRRWANQELRSLNAHVEYLLREAVKRRRGRGDEDERSP